MRVIDIMSAAKSSRGDRVSWWQAALLIRGQTEADQRNIGNFTAWCFVWAVAFGAATYVLRFFPQLPGALAWAVAMVPVLVGAFSIRSFLRFLREADEFTRKVQLEGIALGFGAGQLFCMGYYFLEQFGAPRISMVFAIVPMSFGWAIGSALVASRYR
jgi:hypothetical protein